MFINLKREYALLISIVALILSGVYGDILAETGVGNISGLILIFAGVVYSGVGVGTPLAEVSWPERFGRSPLWELLNYLDHWRWP